MKKFTFMLLAAFIAVAAFAAGSEKDNLKEISFNFNAMDVATSNSGNDGDITEDFVVTEDNVTLTISPKTTNQTENRFWNTADGPQLRIYSGTLTLAVPEGYAITQIVLNHNGK